MNKCSQKPLQRQRAQLSNNLISLEPKPSESVKKRPRLGIPAKSRGRICVLPGDVIKSNLSIGYPWELDLKRRGLGILNSGKNSLYSLVSIFLLLVPIDVMAHCFRLRPVPLGAFGTFKQDLSNLDAFMERTQA
ncbi:uncharacterized protein BDR25DRAFT_354151 [Lindgomyces ingoldianus]|uniref:Uncharacterized protein n=1 Tax=Lindgomyces ingoldianus TaxID=673940 RepID=A0ACB6QX94_9PLEO|nr:uncharacterized protein BDR25DRAFT_354151 [Lindgomyces ingoldianus]KAF2471643.1 hypothetical protein BDR25DRAFT_354151 [Lindgomyces ingoldianus]